MRQLKEIESDSAGSAAVYAGPAFAGRPRVSGMLNKGRLSLRVGSYNEGVRKRGRWDGPSEASEGS